MERTLVLIKPDGIRKGLTCSDIIPSCDLKIVQTRQLTPTIEQARKHYIEHVNHSFYERITNGLVEGEIIAMVIEGENAIKRIRAVIGNRADPTTLRGKYSNPDIQHENAVHGSDTMESAEREIAIWF